MHLFYSSYRYGLSYCLLILTVCFLSCGGDGGGDSSSASTYTWTNIAPYGGFVPSVAFNPENDDIWLSGDDASGLYIKRDASSPWGLIESVPENWSTYALAFDPENTNIVYAPSHFGRGLIRTVNGGSNWAKIGSGLPTTTIEKRINDFAVYPVDSTVLFACTHGGLYKSIDSGLNFTKITSSAFGGYEEFTAMVISDEMPPQIIIGNSKGGVYISTNEGDDWTALVDATDAGLTVFDLAVTPNALYVGFYTGDIGKTTDFANGADYVLINDAYASGDIDSGYTTKLLAIPGASAASDRLYVGTAHNIYNSNWGFHVSTDGGASFTKAVNGLEDNSIFSMAVNPNDPDHVVVGTFNGGVYFTTDAGLNWHSDHGNVHAAASFGFAEDPNNRNHIIFSSSAGLQGTSKVYETFNGGAAWSQVSALDDLNIMSLYIDNDSPSMLLAGTFRNGLYRSLNGSGGPWAQVMANPCSIREVERDAANTSELYAITDEMVESGPSFAGLYFSNNKGASWVRRVDFALHDIKPHPDNGGEAVAVGLDAYATTDSFATVFNRLGLADFAPPSTLFTTIAFDPDNPEMVLVGTVTGALYITENYSSNGGCTWEEITNPAQSINMLDIEIVNKDASQVWYVLCFIGDIQEQIDSTPGIMYSADQGSTWAFLDSGLYPSQLTWRMKKSHFDNTMFYVGMWGGGFMRLEDRR